jgi:hypothetical protein
MVNWRKVNKYFGKLTPFIQNDSPSEAQAISAAMRAAGWHIGDLVIGKDYRLVGPGSDVSNQLYQEIRANAQVISAATGIPIHQLGFPELIGGGRATAQEMTDPMEVISLNDVGTWWDFYNDMFEMAIEMANEHLNGELNPEAVEPKLLPSGTQAWGRIEKVWLPAAINNLISRELFLKQLPDVDVKKEMAGEGSADGAEVEAWLNEEASKTYSPEAGQDGTTPE